MAAVKCKKWGFVVLLNFVYGPVHMDLAFMMMSVVVHSYPERLYSVDVEILNRLVKDDVERAQPAQSKQKGLLHT